MKKYLLSVSFIGLLITTYLYFSHSLTMLEFLLYLSITVYLPFHFWLVGDNYKFYRLILLGYPLGVAGVYLAMASPKMSIVWLVFCGLLAMYGIFRFFASGGYYFEETLIDVSFIYMGLGGLWYVVYMMGAKLFSFSGQVALLTAIHFHYSSLYVLLFAGLLGRIMKRERPLPVWYKWMGAFMIMSPILIALGITYSWVVEVISVCLFVLALIVYGIKSFTIQNWFIKISSLLLMFSMAMAFLYAIRIVDIPFMVNAHGLVNAFGFVGLGMVGYLFISPESHVMISSIPFSKIQGDRVIGTNFFERNEYVEQQVEEHPRGMVDSMEVFERDGFRCEQVHPLIRGFYERTIEFDMKVYPEWHPIFLPAARWYKKFSAKIEQMNFPVLKDEQETEVESRMLKLKDAMDGRENVRAWVRMDKKKNKAIYAAAYSTHQNDWGERYYNVFFPLPFGGMTSILRITNKFGEGVTLTSFSKGQWFEHQGVYLTIGKLTVRLPINEIIDVWEEGGIIKAKHDSWLFGIKVLTLRYEIVECISNYK